METNCKVILLGERIFSHEFMLSSKYNLYVILSVNIIVIITIMVIALFAPG